MIGWIVAAALVLFRTRPHHMITQRHSRLLGRPQYLGASEIQRRCAVGGEVQPPTNNDAVAVDSPRVRCSARCHVNAAHRRGRWV
jgi:hypothetical protein